MGQGMRGGQPLSAFPELLHLIDHDPWFAGRGVRVHSVWDRVRMGYDLYGSALHYRGYLISSRRRNAFLVLVMRQGCPRPVYVNRYKRSADAHDDSASLAREIELRAPVNHQVWGGSDHVHGTKVCARRATFASRGVAIRARWPDSAHDATPRHSG